MSRVALGTYHHSQTVAHLASASAESIGANALLARVGAYYHDIGKMISPEYFIENIQTGTDKQLKISPEKGATTILNHTYNGIIYGRRFHLPQRVLDIITQHHGTSLLKGFYYRALKQSKGKKETPDITTFRYKGPRPQSLEAAIVMISDCIEAASRKMRNPTSEKLRKLIDEVIADQIDQNQFTESGLNFRHLETIKRTLTLQLLAIFHNRMRK
jgi:putative nucleotidyltransferase with HDIG domain